jgi:hypothetical protein
MASDEKQYQERLQRIGGLLADIAGHAQEVSKERCPYKNKPGLCTAQFKCRNQQPLPEGGFRCGHDGTFDYRSAWEVRPDSYEKTREKLRKIREDAAERRKTTAAPEGNG